MKTPQVPALAGMTPLGLKEQPLSRAIQIQVKNVYGLNKAYPACHAAEKFAAIAGTKTLTPTALLNVLAIGFDIHVLGDGFTISAAGPDQVGKVGQLRIAT